MSSLSRKSLFELPRGFAVEKAVLTSGSLAASVAAGLTILHALRLPKVPGQLPGALSAAGFSPAENTVGWLVPIVAVPLAWFAWLALLPRIAGRWPRGRGSFYRDALGFHAALLAAPVLLLRGFPPRASGAAVLAAGLLASAAWVWRARLARQLAPFAGADGGLLLSAGVGLALAVTASGAGGPASRVATWALFAALAGIPAVLAVALSRGAPARFPAAARALGFLSFAPAVLVAGASPVLAIAATAAAGVLLAPLTRRATFDAVRFAVGAVAAPALFLSAVWIGSYRPHSPVSIFEDGHALGPAWEESRGARAFEGTLPLKGWMEDGGYEAASFRLFGPSYAWHRVRRGVFSLITIVSIYLLSRGVFGQTGLAVLATSAALLLSRGGPGPRAAPALLGLSLFALGLRGGRRLPAALGAALASASLFSSVDFGAYAIAAIGFVCIALWPTDPEFRRRISPAAILGAGVLGAAPFLAALAATGRVARWFNFTFRVLPRLAAEAYALPLPDLLAPAGGIPRIRFLTDPVLFVACLCLAILFVRRRHPWGRGLLLCAAGYLFTYRSVAERLYIRRGAAFLGILATAAFAFAASSSWRAGKKLLADRSLPWWMRRSAATALFLALLAAGSAGLVFAATRETTAGLIAAWKSWPHRDAPPGFTAKVPGPAGDGAETTPETARRLSALREFFDRRLAQGETFFDFSNQPGIYFLLGRSNPVPWSETPMMEEPGAERSIIAAMEKKRVRYVLWSWPGVPPESYTVFDDVPNRVRVPELFSYLEQRFPGKADVEGCEIRFRDEAAPSAPGPSSGKSGTGSRLP